MEEENKKDTLEEIKQPEPKKEDIPVVENVEPEVMDESLLAQQPLMAALMENPVPELKPEFKEEPKVEQPFQQQPVQPVPASIFGVPQETINLASKPQEPEEEEEEEEEDVDMSAYAPPSQSSSSDEVVVPKKKKESILPKLISTLLVLVVLGLGGFFVYRIFFAGLNPFVKKIDTLDGTISYLEKKIHVKPSLENEADYGNTYLADDGTWEVTITTLPDSDKIRSIRLVNKDNDLNKLLNVGTPFLKNLSDEKSLNNGVKIVKKHGYIGISRNGVDVAFGRDVDDEKAVIVVSIGDNSATSRMRKIDTYGEITGTNEVKITADGDSLKFKFKDKYNDSELSSLSVDDEIIGGFMISYSETVNILAIASKFGLESTINSSGEKLDIIDVAGTKAGIMINDDEPNVYKYTIVLRSDFKDIDFKNDEDLVYFQFLIEFDADSDTAAKSLFEEILKGIKKG